MPRTAHNVSEDPPPRDIVRAAATAVAVLTASAVAGMLAIIAVAAVLGGCGDPVVRPPETQAQAPRVTPESAPKRIIAFTCGAVDIITALGELDRVIAIEEDCPALGTENKVRIRNDDHPGQVNIVQVEAILALHPDLVIAKSDLKEALDGRGLRVLWSPPVVDMATLPGFVEAIAAELGMPEKGRALLDHMSKVESEIRARVAPLPKVRVYYENNGAGRSVGRGSIVDAMIRLAGGVNIAGDDQRPSVNLSPEVVLAADPEVILLGAFAESPEAVRARPGWERISAVKTGRVHQVPTERRYVTLGTPRCVDGCADFFVPWIHPELATPGKPR
ncbi:MAG: ABC transporter substrate-binding protein [Planctomycetes bacterium]|nr:ABC transporter substrate-binding protein [Planctomycetota bacterium]